VKNSIQTSQIDKVSKNSNGQNRRQFIHVTAGVAGLMLSGCEVAVVAAAIPVLNQIDSDKADLNDTIDIDLALIKPGQEIKVLWGGKPVFVRHRLPDEIKQAQDVDISELPHQESDDDRLVPGPDGQLKPQHLGCIPVAEQGKIAAFGEYGGWYCPCHGAHFDTAGRIRKGPSPTNMEIPPYRYLSDTVIQIG